MLFTTSSHKHTSVSRLVGRVISVIAAGILLAGGASFGRSFYVNYQLVPEAADLLVHDLSILDPMARVDLAAGQKMGRKFAAYLSLVEVADTAAYKKDVAQAGIPLLTSNKEWASKLMDVCDEGWEQFLLEKLARPAIQKGFDGFFLDTVDGIHSLTKLNPDKKDAYERAVIQFVERLRREFPDKEIIMNRGFDLLPQLKGAVNGVLVESVFRTFDARGNYVEATEKDREYLLKKIQEVRAEGLPVYVVDYLSPQQSGSAAKVVSQIRSIGAEPFLTTRELNGQMLGPITRKPRRILVIFGSVVAESEVAEKYEADTMVAERLQMPLEWMGYEVDYLNIGKASPPAELDSRYCGVILDVETQLPYAGESWYVDWILAHKNRGLKILFTGAYPFQQDVQRGRLLKALGVWGTYAQLPRPVKVELKKVNRDVMSYEATLTAHPSEIEDSRAPAGAQIDVSVGCTDEAANQLIFDPIYTTTWGGALLDPYATFQASAEDQASLFDPFKFLPRIWPTGDFPAPDTSTRDGMRIFYSHIDGDGFCGTTPYAGKKICAELVRDRILKKYPFPVTVSLVEATMRGLEEDMEESRVPFYEDVARSCFALPNVQAASHSFSHPYVWIDNDMEYIPLYETRGLKLKASVNYDVDHPSMEREVAGSIDYIQKLCPAGKKVDLMLWSGNCRPSPEALKICNRLGVENMNGGNTVISKRHPFVSNVSPRVMQWDGELQIHAANQNEFIYTQNWNGPFFGGFRQVLETFEATEKPRRLKPVNIYYHFYSSATLGAMKALEQVHDWCLKAPLHSMTALEFARLTRDSYQTEIFQDGPGAWLLVNRGHQRTFRINASSGIPDMAASRGITGYIRQGDSLYIHGNGSPAVRLAFSANPAPHLRLERSQGEITFRSLAPDRANFTVQDFRPSYEVVLAGAASASAWQVRFNDKSSVVRADKDGRISLLLGGRSELSIQPEPAVAIK